MPYDFRVGDRVRLRYCPTPGTIKPFSGLTTGDPVTRPNCAVGWDDSNWEATITPVVDLLPADPRDWSAEDLRGGAKWL